jgi:1,4-dihydroxy-2-naphthoyl-CoA hydrolase
MSRYALRPEVSVASLNARAPGICPAGSASRSRCRTRQAKCPAADPPRDAGAERLPARSDDRRAGRYVSAGYATIAHLPVGAEGFTTIELKTNFLGTLTEGVLLCAASAVHSGRTTQVWDAEVSSEDGRRLALFRCTQMVLWPKVCSPSASI